MVLYITAVNCNGAVYYSNTVKWCYISQQKIAMVLYITAVQGNVAIYYSSIV